MNKIDLRMKTYNKDNTSKCSYCNGIGYTWDNYGKGEIAEECFKCNVYKAKIKAYEN